MCRAMVNFWGCLFMIFSAGTTLQSTSFASSCFTPRPSTSFTANGNRRPQNISNLYSLIFNFRLFFFIIFPIN